MVAGQLFVIMCCHCDGTIPIVQQVLYTVNGFSMSNREEHESLMAWMNEVNARLCALHLPDGHLADEAYGLSQDYDTIVKKRLAEDAIVPIPVRKCGRCGGTIKELSKEKHVCGAMARSFLTCERAKQ